MSLKTPKDQLWQLRHSAEHVLMHAMSRLYPGQFTMAMGPATAEGFYFDFLPGADFKFSETEFKKIEKEMRRLIAADLPITRQEVTPDEARRLFADNPFKQEWIQEAEERGDPISIYWTGEPGSPEAFVDLCAGPHINSTGGIKAVKLLSTAGAYWRGDEHNPMLTRIYGTAFDSEESLQVFLTRLEEAKKRDHRKLGQQFDLFTFSDLVGPGLPLWTPKGTLIRTMLDDFVWQLRQEQGYDRVQIPHITKKDLYVTSGHWDKFSQELFKIHTREGHLFAVKPMNCPHHTQIYASRPRSYKELPHRYAETTMCYRDEQTGELHGLSRVRSFTQDDAHVFCRENQVEAEVGKIWDIIETFYRGCGFPQLHLRLSLHDPEHFDRYLGTPEIWQHAENQLTSIIQAKKVDYSQAVGEAAFYGPKIDFIAEDSLGREWQVATIQVDRNMPERFGLNCTNEAGQPEQIVMIHAAIMGSLERFLSILIEHFAGAFPLWLSPIQVAIIPIGAGHQEYANQLSGELLESKVRSQIYADGSMQKRIRSAEKQKIPYMVILGDQELEKGTLSVRQRGERDQGAMAPDEFKHRLIAEISAKQAD